LIEFVRVPPADEGGPDKMDTIEGRVIGRRAGERIVLFARSGGKWWVQPFSDVGLTEIHSDSKWSSSTHLGTEYAALLVEPGYRPPPTIDFLPGEGAGVIAVATVKGAGSATPIYKTIDFAGYEWKVRTSVSDRGGTSHDYDPANVWTDQAGGLHLRFTKQGAKWACAEVSLTRSLGYGSYRFVVRDSSHLPPAAVLELFTWDDLGTDPNHRELDIQISRWGELQDKNAQYVVQPFYVAANVTRFLAPSGPLAHSFRWEPGKVSFRTVQEARGARRPRVVAEHVFTSGVPAPGGELVHLSFYVFGDASSATPNSSEVVIDSFEYLP
jgi:hypothetical protein